MHPSKVVIIEKFILFPKNFVEKQGDSFFFIGAFTSNAQQVKTHANVMILSKPLIVL